MIEITLPIVLQIVQTIGILVGIIYYITIMRNSIKAQEEAERSRQREQILLRSQIYSLEYYRAYTDTVGMDDWETVEEFHRKYGREANPEAFSKWIYVRSVFNTAGLLLKEKTVDPDLIFQLYAPNAVIGLWEQQEPIIREARMRFKHPTYWEPFEFLYNEAKKRYQEIPSFAQANHKEP